MSKHSLIIHGHPDPKPEYLVHALSTAYRDNARLSGHQVRGIAVSELWFPLHTDEDFKCSTPDLPASLVLGPSS